MTFDGFAHAPALKQWRKRPKLCEGGMTIGSND